jgi:hypothetical protein
VCWSSATRRPSMLTLTARIGSENRTTTDPDGAGPAGDGYRTSTFDAHPDAANVTMIGNQYLIMTSLPVNRLRPTKRPLTTFRAAQRSEMSWSEPAIQSASVRRIPRHSPPRAPGITQAKRAEGRSREWLSAVRRCPHQQSVDST